MVDMVVAVMQIVQEEEVAVVELLLMHNLLSFRTGKY